MDQRYIDLVDSLAISNGSNPRQALTKFPSPSMPLAFILLHIPLFLYTLAAVNGIPLHAP